MGCSPRFRRVLARLLVRGHITRVFGYHDAADAGSTEVWKVFKGVAPWN